VPGVPSNPQGILTGIVFVDTNDNQVQDVDELGIAGVSVIITDSTGTTQTVTTSDIGEYSVSLQAGSYEVPLTLQARLLSEVPQLLEVERHQS
jgi:hypothetical protein